ncbi:MAG TPA: sulfite exporter TauE/SafE family protein [Burkholderiales bacterium]|nr:sulfite exporter TauE/SafE family protein [Burkholderiales bacterium]
MDAAAIPWWIWPIALFVVSFAIGIIAVLAGVGGGVLFVPIVGSLFPFHLDFVRGAGLMFALAGTLAAGPPLLRAGMASLRLVMPLALVGSIASFAGALVGLALATAVLNTLLGLLIIGIAILIWRSRAADAQNVEADGLGALLRLQGEFHDPAAGLRIDWRTHRTLLGLAAFAAIGFVGGIFGLGAGFANVPALNLLMSAPLKVAVGSSGLLISVINSSAAWVYIHRGALLPLIVVPAILGVMLGSRLGARLLGSTPAALVRRLVIVVMLIAGLRALARGTGLWM